ncbi:MAG: YfcC family protein [Oscillospiraceae bacterium]|nr:YfcC family protein [Oscillospiraceae bacterium]
MGHKDNEGLSISVRSFVTAIAIIFLLMVAAYLLTFLIPAGSYSRVPDPGGNLIIDTSTEFTVTDGGIPFWKWLLSPALVLGAQGSGTLIAVIIFLLVIGGVFNCLERCGLMKYMLHKTVNRFSTVRYRLMAIVTLLFMAMGSLVGSFEECVPMVPIIVALAIDLGWDALTGIGMSLLAAGCGFAAGVCNPFTIGVAQQLAGLPMFSGAWLRMLSFLLIYLLLYGFLHIHAKKIERPLEKVLSTAAFESDRKMDKGLISFILILGAGIVIILCSGFITALQDYTMIIVAVMFLAAGISSTLLCGMSGRTLGKAFLDGVKGIFPAVLMILMASSIRYTLEEAKILDTILHEAVVLAQQLPGWAVILFIYLIVLIMNFFIPSGSAKAFMLIPLIVPMAQVFGLSAQLCVVAFAFGDGFSNVFYPTNPALLIALGLADVSYQDWFRWSAKFQILNLILTGMVLIFGLVVGY